MRPLWFGLATALALALTAPAQASGMPRADFEAGQLTVSGGVNGVVFVVPLATASVDYSPMNRLSVGLGASMWTVNAHAVLRALQGPSGSTLGLMVAGGFNNDQMIFGTLGPVLAGGAPLPAGPAFYTPGRDYTGPWGQLALVGSLPLGPLVLRGMLGPMYGNAQFMGVPPAGDPNIPIEERMTLAFIPNVELAWRIAPHHELTVGGFSWVGYRGIF
ncbi:MAG: hypothetical protein JWM80_6152 [Cyanobacteria bacterium RYN_339]|nr:hypothetical protein [Cyanobacteria bacterium RYN_339]